MTTLWQSVAMFLGGVVITLGGVWLTFVKNAVSREEMEKYVNDRIGNLEREVHTLNINIMDLKTLTARIEGSLSGVQRSGNQS